MTRLQAMAYGRILEGIAYILMTQWGMGVSRSMVQKYLSDTATLRSRLEGTRCEDEGK